jgi:hypothetical protein
VDEWKFLEARSAKVGGVDCLAVQISYTGTSYFLYKSKAIESVLFFNW